MELTAFLSADDARRAEHTLGVLARHEIEPLALTGGLAIEMHCVRRGLPADMRPLNDIDFVASTFSDIAQTLDADFIFRHVHPCESPGKMLVQCVDAVAALRVDIFRACGNTMARTEHFTADCCAWFRLQIWQHAPPGCAWILRPELQYRPNMRVIFSACSP